MAHNYAIQIQGGYDPRKDQNSPTHPRLAGKQGLGDLQGFLHHHLPMQLLLEAFIWLRSHQRRRCVGTVQLV
jgi:hypothetical protein